MKAGREFLHDSLGEGKTKVDFARLEYEPFDKAVAEAKKKNEQEGKDPTNPEKELSKDLLLALKEKLGLEGKENSDSLTFYSARDTVLQKFHGVDAWFEKVTDEGRVVSVTIDLTTNVEDAKLGNINKADIIIVNTEDKSILGKEDKVGRDNGGDSVVFYASVGDPEEKDYVGWVDEIAILISQVFKEKEANLLKKAA